MTLGIMQTVSLRTGEKVKLVEKQNDKWLVGWTDEDGKYWDRLVSEEDIIIKQEEVHH